MKIIAQHYQDSQRRPGGGETRGKGFSIQWQDGPLLEAGRNGALIQELLDACADRIRFIQSTPEAQVAYEGALISLRQAKDAIAAGGQAL